MKTTVYMRVGTQRNRRVKVDARTTRPTSAPLYESNGDAMPTVAFAIKLELPDAMFNRAREVLAEITVPEEQAQIAAEVVQLDEAR